MTRNNDTSYRTKGRAVLFAAIMVVSMVAIGFAGSAAAEAPRNVDDPSNVLGQLNYEGQTFDFTNSSGNFKNAGTGAGANPVFSDYNITGSDTLYLVRVDDRSDSGDSITSASTVGTAISVDGSGTNANFEVDLDGLDPSEEYALSNETGSSGTFSTSFDVQTQDPELDWGSDSANDRDTDIAADFTLDRNEDPSNYNLTVWARGPEDLSSDQIIELLNHSGNQPTINGTIGNYDTSTTSGNEGDFIPFDALESDYDIDVDADDRNSDAEFETLVDEGIVTFELNGSQPATDELNLNANFSDMEAGPGLPDSGEYEFTFLVTDTGVSSSDSISISEANAEADLAEGATQTPAGDIAEFSVTLEDTSDAYVQIGGEDSDFVDVLYIDPDDADEPVNVSINTRLFGTNADKDAVFDYDNTDTFESEVHGGGLTTPDSGVNLYGDDSAGNNRFDADDGSNNYLDNLGIGNVSADDQITRPLQPTEYSIIVASDVGLDSSSEAVFDADPGGEANNQLDSRTLELTQPEIGEITTHTAPEDDADATSEVSELVSDATPREEIAADDRLIVQVEATGIYGALVANASNSNGRTNWDRLDDGVSSDVLAKVTNDLTSGTDSNESINFGVTAESSTGNQDPLEVDIAGDSGGVSDGDVFVVLDEDNGQFFLVVDTSSNNAFANGDAPDSETAFSAELEYDADNGDDRYELADNNKPFEVTSNAQNYPYLLQGETLSSSASLDIAPRSITYDNVNEDDEIQAQNVEDATISGETNVAPGSDAELRIQGTGGVSFQQGQDVNISEDGSVTATFDLSDRSVGDEFTSDFRISGGSEDSTNGVIVESVGDTGDEETNETETDDGEEMDDGETEPADDGETNESTDDGGESTDDGTPGFGAVVALIALIGAALLAVRRQN